MSYPHHTHEPDADRFGGRRARSRWWAVGLAGVTGLALTTVGVIAIPTADAAERTLASADDWPGQPARASTGSHHEEGKPDDKDNAKGKDEKENKSSKGITVPCDTDKLIAAITLANARGGAVLDLAKDCTYLLTSDIAGSGLPAITTPITLNGGKHTTIKRAAAVDQFRILAVRAGGDLTLNRLETTGGQTNENGGGVLVVAGGRLIAKDSSINHNITTAGNGGGIFSIGTAIFEQTTVRNNTAISGGGIYNSFGVLTITKSQVKTNAANNNTGGVASVGSPAVVTIAKSVIAGNNSQGTTGGLLVNDGVGRVYDTKITGNNAVSFGAIYSDGGQLTLKEVDITNNTASNGFAGGLFVETDSTAVIEKGLINGNVSLTNFGGGVYNLGDLVIRDTTVVGNQAEEGGGVYNSGGTATLFNTQVAKNVAVSDGGGIVNSGGTVNLSTATGTVVIKNRPNNCVNVPGCAG